MAKAATMHQQVKDTMNSEHNSAQTHRDNNLKNRETEHTNKVNHLVETHDRATKLAQEDHAAKLQLRHEEMHRNETEHKQEIARRNADVERM
jgi:hypothetical protein